MDGFRGVNPACGLMGFASSTHPTVRGRWVSRAQPILRVSKIRSSPQRREGRREVRAVAPSRVYLSKDSPCGPIASHDWTTTGKTPLRSLRLCGEPDRTRIQVVAFFMGMWHFLSTRFDGFVRSRKPPICPCEPFDTLRINSARQSSTTHCPESKEGSPLDRERSFDPPKAASGRLALQVGLPRLRAVALQRAGTAPRASQ
jgi:hypothetical protein